MSGKLFSVWRHGGFNGILFSDIQWGRYFQSCDKWYIWLKSWIVTTIISNDATYLCDLYRISKRKIGILLRNSTKFELVWLIWTHPNLYSFILFSSSIRNTHVVSKSCAISIRQQYCTLDNCKIIHLQFNQNK